jgi:hypothetical protein
MDPLMSLMISQPPIDVTTPVKAVAGFDPPVIAPGQESTYRVTFNALEASIKWPDAIKATPSLSLRPGAHGQLLQMTGASLIPFTTFNSHARPTETGKFTVPSFTVDIYGKPVTVPETTLEVSVAATDQLPAPHLSLEVDKTNLFVGQAVVVQAALPFAPGSLASMGPVQLNGDGFIVDQSTILQHSGVLFRQGRRLPAAIYQVLLNPIAAGEITVSAQAYAGNAHFSGPFVLAVPPAYPGRQPPFTLLESDPVVLHVRPLPRHDDVAGFSGAVGNFGFQQPPRLSTNVVHVGEPVDLAVAITNRAEANPARLLGPPPPSVRDWQVFPASTGNPPVHYLLSRGVATFHYTLIPRSADAHSTPEIPFSYFDPDRGSYVDLTVPGVPVTILPVEGAEGISPITLSDTNSESEPRLSGLAVSPGLKAGSLAALQRRWWFPIAQLAPAVAFVSLWGWDRRRRFLEQHPEILLRRHARRALRRERRALRRAARLGDAQAFSTAAVSAIRAGCAPHFPAEPQALVGADVLQLLEQKGSATPGARASEVVRRFFDFSDASRFGSHAPAETQLLALQPEVEQMLEELEAKL